MRTAERIEKTRNGWCGKCGQDGVMKTADVSTFTLAGTSQLASYDPKTWEGYKCTNCGNEAAIGKEDAVMVLAPDGE